MFRSEQILRTLPPKPLDQATILKHLVVCGVDVSKSTADNKEVSHLSGHAQEGAYTDSGGLWVCRRAFMV